MSASLGIDQRVRVRRELRESGREKRAEERDADAPTRLIDEVNVGTYAFDLRWLRSAIDRVEPSASGELYLTDLVALVRKNALKEQTTSAQNSADPMTGIATNIRI